MIGTEVFYMWKEVIIVTRDDRNELLVQPYERLVTPHGDPMVYEFPIDTQFNNMRAAIDWRDEEIEIANDTQDADYIAEMQRWVLTKVTQEPVDDVAASWQATATRILEARRTGDYQPLIDSLPEHLRPT